MSSVSVRLSHAAERSSAHLSVLQTSQEAQVEDLELVVQLHAHDAVVPVDAEQDPGGLAILPQDHLHLDAPDVSACQRRFHQSHKASKVTILRCG